MIPLIGLLLCVYLVFKGFEIFQIALCAPASNARKAGIALGVAAFATSIVVAGLFAFMLISSSVAMPTMQTP